MSDRENLMRGIKSHIHLIGPGQGTTRKKRREREIWVPMHMHLRHDGRVLILGWDWDPVGMDYDCVWDERKEETKVLPATLARDEVGTIKHRLCPQSKFPWASPRLRKIYLDNLRECLLLDIQM